MERRRVNEEDWIAHPSGENLTEAAKYLVEKRDSIWVLAVIVDEDRSYEYDEFALIRLGRKYYLLNTMGCSCPSPSETWTIEIGPTSLRKVREHILSGSYAGCSLPVTKRDEFIAAIDEETKRRERRKGKKMDYFERAALKFSVAGNFGEYWVPITLVVGEESRDSEGRRLVRIEADSDFRRVFVPYVPADSVFDPYGGTPWFERSTSRPIPCAPSTLPRECDDPTSCPIQGHRKE